MNLLVVNLRVAIEPEHRAGDQEVIQQTSARSQRSCGRSTATRSSKSGSCCGFSGGSSVRFSILKLSIRNGVDMASSCQFSRSGRGPAGRYLSCCHCPATGDADPGPFSGTRGWLDSMDEATIRLRRRFLLRCQWTACLEFLPETNGSCLSQSDSAGISPRIAGTRTRRMSFRSKTCLGHIETPQRLAPHHAWMSY